MVAEQLGRRSLIGRDEMKPARSILFLEIDGLRRATHQPLSIRVEDRLREAILDGNLGPGARLPSSRVLAGDLKVSRYTVEWAFDRLEAEGFVVRRPGSGTFVADEVPDRARSPSVTTEGSRTRAGTLGRPETNGAAALSMRGRGLTVPLFAWKPAPGTAFTASLPAPDLFPRQIWGRLITRAVRRPGLDSWIYGPGGGLPQLKEAIAAHIGGNRAVACSPDQIVVVSSAHQAVDLIVRVLLDEGDAIWIEDPCYAATLRVFRGAGTRVVPIPVDSQGFNVESAWAAEPGARLAFVTPSHQFPSGVRMSLSRRMALLAWAQRENGWIIEDDYDGDLHFAGRPLAPLQRLDTAGRVIYVGTFSKMMFPSLRLAFLVAPPGLIDAFRRAKHTMDGHAPGHTQAALSDFIQEGHLATHLRRVIGEYDRRRLALLDAVANVADLLEPGPAESGLQICAYLRHPVDDQALVDLCGKAGVDLLPLSRFYLGPPRQGLVMGFACSHPARTRVAMRIVGRAIRSLR